MKLTTLSGILVILGVVAGSHAAAQDIREAARKATADREAAAKEARESEARILADRQSLVAEVNRLESETSKLDATVRSLTERIESLARQREALTEQWAGEEFEFREVSGNVRVVARDLESLLRQSLTSPEAPYRLKELARILDEGYFPDIEDVSTIASLLFDEMDRSGEVALSRGVRFRGRGGDTVEGTVLRLGTFTAAYRNGKETGLLRYTPEQQQLAALSALPPRRIRGQINRYIDGKSDDVPVDLSGGLALRQLTSRTGLVQQLRSGGPVVYPILLIALAALIITVERILYLRRVHGNADRLMGRVQSFASQGQWNRCEELIADLEKEPSPLASVLHAGLNARKEEREAQESILQEAILREVPRLERFLPVLAALGTIAPLLGLLGTVTGMIGTFQVITLHGTGNPRLMSGGISEALITTELGLAVAIPIILVHVLLARRVNRLVGEMEENALGLANVMQVEGRKA